jgi:predicted dithiol-disulfide oxidoreductase (DUF899 family)
METAAFPTTSGMNDNAMSTLSFPLHPDEWRRIREALRYQARDLHHRSYAVDAVRRELLWEEMDRCLQLADRIEVLLAEPEP